MIKADTVFVIALRIVCNAMVSNSRYDRKRLLRIRVDILEIKYCVTKKPR